MTESFENIFQIGEALEQRLANIEDQLDDQINKIVDLSRVGTVFTSLFNLDLILPMVIETALRIVKGEVGEVIIFDRDGELKSVNWGLSPEITRKIKTDKGINVIDHFRNSGEALIINDLHFADENVKNISKISVNSIIAAPLKSKEKVVGAIIIANKENQQEFDGEDKFTLELLGNFAAVAVKNVELHKEALVKQEIEHELKLAEQVQNTLIPDSNETYPGIEVKAYHDQAGQVGGDFYDILKLSEGRYLIVVADVSNKGIPAALIMTSARSYIRVAAETMTSLPGLAKRVNKLLCNDIQRLGGMFVTMFFGLIDFNEQKLYSLNAGHPPCYFYHGKKVERLKTGGTFIGQFPDIDFKEAETEIKSGDRFIVFTDGMFECVNTRGEMLGLEKLSEFLKKYNGIPWDKFTEKVKTLLSEYSYDSARVDDTTLIRVEIKN